MRKLTLLTIVLLMAAAAGLKAQTNASTLQHTAWKAYVDAVHDSLTLHIGNDSSFVTDGGGEVVVRSVCKMSKDTLSLKDYDGKYFCPDGEGVYKLAVTGNMLTFNLIMDPCEGRSSSLNGIQWIQVKDKH